MSLSSDNFTALIHLRDQARKWKNITFVTIIVAFIILGKFIFFKSAKDNDLSNNDSYIASVEIDGIIFSDSYRSKVLKEILEKDNIKAVIVNIDSPGGGIVGSEMLYNEISAIAKKKPVVVTMGSVAASGGYMTALASDHIIAYNGTLTGSIGVILQSAEITKMADELGIKLQNYKSSHLKGTPSPFEKSDYLIDQAIGESVMDSYKFFTDLVIERRKGKIKTADIKRITDGRVFTGRQALAVGLIDQIGGEKEALAYLKDKRKISGLEVREVSLKKAKNKFIDNILGGFSFAELLNQVQGRKQLMSVW